MTPYVRGRTPGGQSEAIPAHLTPFGGVDSLLPAACHRPAALEGYPGGRVVGHIMTDWATAAA
jgi:hypothetical protein